MPSPTPKPTWKNLARALRNRHIWSALARKRNDGGESLDKEQFKSPTEGGSGPSSNDFNNKAEGGGDIDYNKEKDRQGSNHKPTANRAQVGGESTQGTDKREPKEQGDTKEQ